MAAFLCVVAFAPPPSCGDASGELVEKKSRGPYHSLSKEQITLALKTLSENGHGVSSGVMIKNDPEANRLVSTALGIPTTTGAVYQAGVRRYKKEEKWRSALLAADLDPDEVKVKPLFSRETIWEALRALRTEGRPINSGNIQKDRSAKTSAILKEKLGIETTGAALFQAARWYDGKWDVTLAGAEFDPKEIRLHAKWNKEIIRDVVVALSTTAVPLNSFGIRQAASEEFRAVMKKLTGHDASGAALLDRAVHYYGSWDNALRAGGLDPAKIRMKQWRRAGLSLIPHQTETNDDGSGGSKTRKLIGKAAKAPEAAASENELFDRVQTLTGKLEGDDGALVNEIVEVILSSDTYVGPEEIAQQLRSVRNEPVSPEKVKSLLDKVASMLGSG